VLAGYDHLLTAARRLQWDERAIALDADAAAWPSVGPAAAGRIRRLVAGFLIAEAAVAEHLTPFVAAGADPRVRALLALQQGDEARHERWFARVGAEVVGIASLDAARAEASPALVELFERRLPEAAAQVADDGADGLPDGVALYHLVLEGIVLSVAQQALADELDALPELRGLRAGADRVQADERWHIGLGVALLAEAGADLDADRLDAAAALAEQAWSPDVATPERLAWVRHLHARRLREAGGAANAAPAR
jgi:ribonucleoside-diphosphate reductase beta chain